jgi:hypothetical protein
MRATVLRIFQGFASGNHNRRRGSGFSLQMYNLYSITLNAALPHLTLLHGSS